MSNSSRSPSPRIENEQQRVEKARIARAVAEEYPAFREFCNKIIERIGMTAFLELQTRVNNNIGIVTTSNNEFMGVEDDVESINSVTEEFCPHDVELILQSETFYQEEINYAQINERINTLVNILPPLDLLVEATPEQVVTMTQQLLAVYKQLASDRPISGTRHPKFGLACARKVDPSKVQELQRLTTASRKLFEITCHRGLLSWVLPETFKVYNLVNNSKVNKLKDDFLANQEVLLMAENVIYSRCFDEWHDLFHDNNSFYQSAEYPEQ